MYKINIMHIRPQYITITTDAWDRWLAKCSWSKSMFGNKTMTECDHGTGQNYVRPKTITEKLFCQQWYLLEQWSQWKSDQSWSVSDRSVQTRRTTGPAVYTTSCTHNDQSSISVMHRITYTMIVNDTFSCRHNQFTRHDVWSGRQEDRDSINVIWLTLTDYKQY